MTSTNAFSTLPGIVMLWIFPLLAIASDYKTTPDFHRFIQWITGSWDNQQQVEVEKEQNLPLNERHHRYPMRYVPVEISRLGGVVFDIHNYGDAGFDGELRRISLHRFHWNADSREIVHQFLFVIDKEAYGPFEHQLEKLAELGWDDVRQNPSCNMYWQWHRDHFEGRTRPESCVTSSFTPEPIRIEARGELWPGKLVRHDRNYTMEGDIIPRDGGESPEVFCKPEVNNTCF